MSATITTLPSRLGESAEVAEVHNRKAAAQSLEAGPARDSFIAETATKIEQLQAAVRLLSREVGELGGKLAEVQEIAGQDHRLYTFQQNEKQGRDSKLDEAVRTCRDLKARLDRIEARSSGDYHAFNSFEAVSRKFGEIERSRNDRNSKNAFRTWLLSGMLIALGLAGGIMLAGPS